MNLVLPPKRFETSLDAKYDVLRHFPWFGRLDTRRAKISLLKAAYGAWKRDGKTQKEASEMYGVDDRELRDYAAFVAPVALPIPREWQAILDHAYYTYSAAGGKNSIRTYIELSAKLWGINPRHVIEAWETDPNFYPTSYKPFCHKCGSDYAMVKHKDGRWFCHKTHDYP